jgi:hypothetical protein
MNDGLAGSRIDKCTKTVLSGNSKSRRFENPWQCIPHD